MSELLSRMFAFLDSPDERPWVAMGAFAVFVMLGCLWIHQAQVLPGVSSTDTGLEGEVLDMQWGSDGTDALALVDSNSGPILQIRDSDGTWDTLECTCSPTAIGGSDSSWIIGGENGWFGQIDAGSKNLMTRSLEWGESPPDILSIDGDLYSGWMIVELENGIRGTVTWDLLEVSNHTPAPLESIILTDVEVVSGGALLIGYDLSAGNPADGPTAEVLIAGSVVPESAPHLDLLHLGAGAPFHTILSTDDGPWSDVFIGIVAGGDSVYGIQMDHSVHRIPGSTGSDTMAMDSEGGLWLSDDSTLLTFGMGDSSSRTVLLPEGVGDDIGMAFSAGDSVVLIASDGSERVTIDPSAQHSILQSLQILGDFILFLVFLVFAGFGAHTLLRRHEIF
ncbi:MAG: hypothetical protein VX320_01525 [Candidatus Thermoplasmatota archaeon]|nr:hypothetical protein [Candidatus Thermoplasmatota archaeon]